MNKLDRICFIKERVSKLDDNLEYVDYGLLPCGYILKDLDRIYRKDRLIVKDIVERMDAGLLHDYISKFFILLYKVRNKDIFSMIEDRDTGYEEVIPYTDGIRPICISEIPYIGRYMLLWMYCTYIEFIDLEFKNYILSTCIYNERRVDNVRR